MPAPKPPSLCSGRRCAIRKSRPTPTPAEQTPIGLIEERRRDAAAVVDQRPQEKREREVRIENEEADLLKKWLWILGPPLLLSTLVASGAIDPSHLSSDYFDSFSHWSWLLSR